MNFKALFTEDNKANIKGEIYTPNSVKWEKTPALWTLRYNFQRPFFFSSLNGMKPKNLFSYDGNVEVTFSLPLGTSPRSLYRRILVKKLRKVSKGIRHFAKPCVCGSARENWLVNGKLKLILLSLNVKCFCVP